VTDMQKLGDEVVRSLSKAAGENSLSAALIGAGILWMMTGAMRPALAPLSRMVSGVGSAGAVPLIAAKDAVVSGLGTAGEAVTAAASIAQNAVGDGGTSVAKTLSNAQQHTSRYSGEMYQSAGEMTGSLKESLSYLFEQQPLALAAVGLAIGAGIAASIPTSDIEIEFMGQASTDVASSLSALVSEQAGAVKDAVLNVADKQGLTPDKAKEAVQAGIEKVKSVIAPSTH
jgi:hypothetical protein